MDRPYYYLRAEDRVPRDAVHVVIGGSIKVVAPHAFQGHENLERVEFQEGVEEIGAYAFWRCPNLTRVDCPSSLRAIGNYAFAECRRLSEAILHEGLRRIGRWAFGSSDLTRITVPSSVVEIGDNAFSGCRRLSEVILREGLEGIGSGAFDSCALERIAVPSSVAEIGDGAFAWCRRLLEAHLMEGLRLIGTNAFGSCILRQITVPSSVVEIGPSAFNSCPRLSEVHLMEGLQRIGARAFLKCSLERIAVPSSVVEIGEQAFAGCINLEVATLAGGMVLMARGAFFRCPRLERIMISSMAIVVEAGEDGNGRTAEVTGGINGNGDDEPEPVQLIRDRRGGRLKPAQLILTSCYLALMSQEDRAKMMDLIDQITDYQTRGAGSLDLEDEGVAHQIRARFANCLEEYKAGVAAVLELALWKANMNRRREASPGRAAGEGDMARADAPTRDDCRRTCGAEVVVGPVLSYLWGPHRRADEAEVQDRSGSEEEGLLVPRAGSDRRGRRMRWASLWRTMLKMIRSKSSATPLS